MLSWGGERDESVESGSDRDGLFSSVQIMQAGPISVSALAVGFSVPLPEPHGPGLPCLSSRHGAELPSGPAGSNVVNTASFSFWNKSPPNPKPLRATVMGNHGNGWQARDSVCLHSCP